MWVPENTLLGTHAELATFTYTIQYYVPGTEGDPLADPPTSGTEDVYYPVRVTAQEVASTVDVTDDTISGYYKGIFNDTLVTRDFNNNFTTLTTLTGGEGGVFDKVNRDTLHEVISFKADTTRSRTFHYLAEAMDGETVIASQEYTILAQDRNWTPGKNNLKELVAYGSSK